VHALCVCLFYPLFCLEKAFAKLNGNYEQCASGHFGEGMTDLTGEGCESFDLARIDKEELWKNLVYFHEEAFLMGCSVPLPNAGAQAETDNGNGLLVGHAYAVLKVVTTKSSNKTTKKKENSCSNK
jgi:hypothetical protein